MIDIKKFEIEGPLLITLKSFKDDRGFFVERYNEKIFAAAGLPTSYVQDNFSRSAQGVLRGLHCQHSPTQLKLVTCTSGSVQDIIVDVRSGSSTFGKYLSVDLSGEQPQWFLIPAGFAHGFLVTSKEPADIMYKVDNYYSPSTEFALLWNDSALHLPWKNTAANVSPKDAKALPWSEFQKINPF